MTGLARSTTSSSRVPSREMKTPASGGTFLLRLGDELVVRQVEAVDENERPRLRLIPASTGYAPRACLARDVRILGKVVWVVRRV